MQSELRQFAALVEAASITAGAKALGITQPALTKSLKRLEDHLGIKLVDRLPRGIKVTEAGHRIYERAKAVEAELRYLDFEAKSIRDDVRKRVSIGSIPFWNVSSVPRIVSKFRSRFPGVRLTITVDTQSNLIEAMRIGALDLALCGMDLGMKSDAVGYEVLTGVDLKVACGRSHPLLRRWSGRTEDLLDYAWVDYRSSLDHTLGRIDAPVLWPIKNLGGTVETDSWLGGILLTAKSDFLMALPRQLESFFKPFGVVFLPGSPVLTSSQSGIWYRKSIVQTEIGKVLRAIAREEMLGYENVGA